MQEPFTNPEISEDFICPITSQTISDKGKEKITPQTISDKGKEKMAEPSSFVPEPKTKTHQPIVTLQGHPDAVRSVSLISTNGVQLLVSGRMNLPNPPISILQHPFWVRSVSFDDQTDDQTPDYENNECRIV